MELITLEGTVENIVYSNEENGYTVCRIANEDELFCAVGYMPYLSEGEVISVRGVWDVHPNFGRQFKVEFYEKKLPTSVSSIYKYLASGAIRGIGPVTAERIVKLFGEETFSVIENNHTWLTDIKGITAKRANEIHDFYVEQYGMRSVMVFCATYFGPSIAVKIYKKYGPSAIDVIKLNPYLLVDDINGIAFPTADRVAKDLGFENDCKERIEAALKYTLSRSMFGDGHCFLSENELVGQTASALGADFDAVMPVLHELTSSGRLVARRVGEYDAVYEPEMAEAEKYTADKLVVLDNSPRLAAVENVSSHIASLEKEFDCVYAHEQREAITSAVTNGVTIVTGGPGTGKTTVIKAIIDIFSTLDISFSLCAPTGRAAKRMTEASGYEAKTIHRLLEMDYSGELSEPKFTRNDENPLPCKALIIDEMSMVDILLMASLLKAVKPGVYLVLIGDADQLPSVGPGNVLRDLIASERFNVVKLTHIFRQASESLIITNAHAVNRGELPELDNRKNDFFFLENYDPASVSALVSDLCRTRLPKTYNADPLEDIQVITPTRRGALGTPELNRALQAALNPQDGMKNEKRIGDTLFRVGDKVMQIKNNYDIVWERDGKQNTGIFNGDIGKILEICDKSESMVIDFDGRITEYDFALGEELELAYAITVHKAQGSEYPIVILVLLASPPMLQTRNLLYTAITRAQKMVVVCGSRGVVKTMVMNDRKVKRFTALRELLEI